MTAGSRSGPDSGRTPGVLNTGHSFYMHYWDYREQSNCFQGDNAGQEFAAT